MREYITDHAIANAIRMKRPLFVGAFLVVEGISDKLVYGLVIDHEGCSIEIAHDRVNTLGAVRILNAYNFSGVLGIVDADLANIADAYSLGYSRRGVRSSAVVPLPRVGC